VGSPQKHTRQTQAAVSGNAPACRENGRPYVLLPEQRAVGPSRPHVGATTSDESVVGDDVAMWHGREEALHVGKTPCVGEERVVGEEVWVGNCVEQATWPALP
jgi:hypothetical protein